MTQFLSIISQNKAYFGYFLIDLDFFSKARIMYLTTK